MKFRNFFHSGLKLLSLDVELMPAGRAIQLCNINIRMVPDLHDPTPLPVISGYEAGIGSNPANQMSDQHKYSLYLV
jgi:hypothetical protein